MIYDIVYDKGTRLRVRAGKEAFTKEEQKSGNSPHIGQDLSSRPLRRKGNRQYKLS